MLFLYSLAVLKSDIFSEAPLMGQLEKILRMEADKWWSLIDSSLPDIHILLNHFVLNHDLGCAQAFVFFFSLLVLRLSTFLCKLNSALH